MDKKLKHSGLLVCIVLIVVIVILYCIIKSHMGGKASVKQVTSMGSISSEKASQTASVQSQVSQKQESVTNAGSSSAASMESLKEIDASQLNKTGQYTENGVLTSKKAFIMSNEVYYADYFTTSSGKQIRYFVSLDTYIAYPIQSKFNLGILEYTDDANRVAYAISDMTPISK